MKHYNWFERQKKLRKMLLTVISSENLRKTYEVDVFNPVKRKRKWLKRNKNNKPSSCFLYKYFMSKGDMKRYKIHEIGDVIVVENTIDNIYRHLKFYSNEGETFTLDYLYNNED